MTHYGRRKLSADNSTGRGAVEYRSASGSLHQGPARFHVLVRGPYSKLIRKCLKNQT